jgi:DNA polymerase III delta prime subunit
MILMSNIAGLIEVLMRQVNSKGTQLPDADILIILASELGIFDDRIVVARLLSYRLAPEWYKFQHIWRVFEPYIQREKFRPDPFRPYPKSEVNGDVRLGLVRETQSVFGLNINELMQSVLIAGRPGIGKTTVCYNIIQEANRNGVNCLMLDVKQDYRHQIKHNPNTVVLRCSNEDLPFLFKWNVLDPPVSVGLWIPVISDITAESYNFFAASSSFLMRNLAVLYRKMSPQIPTLIDLMRWLESMKIPLISRECRFKETTVNRFQGITYSAYRTVNCQHSHDIHSLLKKYNVVIELDALGTDTRGYFATLILAHFFQYRIMNRSIANPVLVIFDEANEVFNKIIEKNRGNMRISTLARQAREFGMGLIACCQLPEAVSNSIKNCYTRIMMGLTEGQNIADFSRSIGLDRDQQEVLWSLQTGEGIVRFARYPRPFRVVFPPFPVQKDVTDAELAVHIRRFADELGLDEQDDGKTESASTVHEEKPPKEEKQEDTAAVTAEPVKDELKMLLMNVYLRPYLSITQHQEGLKLSAGKCNRLIKQLIKDGLCEIVPISLGGRGKRSKFLDLTDKAYVLLGVEKPKRKTKGGGFEHYFWQEKIAMHYQESGYKAEIEKIIGNKSIDVVITKGISVAVEIAMSAVNESVNLAKDIREGCKYIVVACRDRNLKKEIERIVDKHGYAEQAQIKVVIVYELLDSKDGGILAF